MCSIHYRRRCLRLYCDINSTTWTIYIPSKLLLLQCYSTLQAIYGSQGCQGLRLSYAANHHSSDWGLRPTVSRGWGLHLRKVLRLVVYEQKGKPAITVLGHLRRPATDCRSVPAVPDDALSLVIIRSYGRVRDRGDRWGRISDELVVRLSCATSKMQRDMRSTLIHYQPIPGKSRAWLMINSAGNEYNPSRKVLIECGSSYQTGGNIMTIAAAEEWWTVTVLKWGSTKNSVMHLWFKHWMMAQVEGICTSTFSYAMTARQCWLGNSRKSKLRMPPGRKW